MFKFLKCRVSTMPCLSSVEHPKLSTAGAHEEEFWSEAWILEEGGDQRVVVAAPRPATLRATSP